MTTPLKCDILHDVTVLPGEGKLHGNTLANRYALGAFINHKPLAQVHIYGAKPRTRQLPEVLFEESFEEPAIYGGIFFHTFGHFICETLQRLWYAKKHPHLPIVWVGGVNTYRHLSSVPETHQNFFSFLQIKNKHIFLQKPTLFKTLHIPEPGFGINAFLHPEHANALVYKEFKVQKGKYVYLSRAKYKGCSNEHELENMLKDLGWIIYYPEDLSMEEQIKMLASSEVCLMIAGSAQHSLLFTKNSQTRYIVIPRINSITYQTIAALKSDNYFILNTTLKRLSKNYKRNLSVFSVDVQQIKDIIIKTDNFKKIEHFQDLVSPNNMLSKKYYEVPACYRTNPCHISKHDALFYQAVHLYKNNYFEQAYTLFLELKNEKMLLPYMYERYFQTLQACNKKLQLGISLEDERKTLEISANRIEVERDPKNSYKLLNFIKALRLFEQHDMALKYASILKNIEPEWTEVYKQLSLIYEGKNDLQKSIVFAEKSIVREKKNITNYLHLLRLYHKQNQSEKILSTLINAITINSTWKNQLIFTASKYLNSQKLYDCIVEANILNKDALHTLQREIKISNQKIYASRVQTYTNVLLQRWLKKKSFDAFHAKHYMEAEYRVKKVIVNNPNISWGHYILARIQQVYGDCNLALENVKKAISLDPTILYYHVFAQELQKNL